MLLWRILGCPGLNLSNIYAHTHCEFLYVCVFVCVHIHICVYVCVCLCLHIKSKKNIVLYSKVVESLGSRFRGSCWERMMQCLETGIVKFKMPEACPCWMSRRWADVFLSTKETCGRLGCLVSNQGSLDFSAHHWGILERPLGLLQFCQTSLAPLQKSSQGAGIGRKSGVGVFQAASDGPEAGPAQNAPAHWCVRSCQGDRDGILGKTFNMH